MKNSNLVDKKGVSWLFLLIYKNEWNNLLSKKQRCDNKKKQNIIMKMIKKD